MPPEENVEQLKKRVEELEHELGAARHRPAVQSVRKRSERMIGNWPLYEVAIGPDLERGEMRGHARGIIAVGDIATGVLALGGIARGVIAIGGLSVGLVGIGGCTIGLAAAVGGVALGGVVLGGVAIGAWAFGGLAIGLWACGGEAIALMRS
jgi:hypothetical protein